MTPDAKAAGGTRGQTISQGQSSSTRPRHQSTASRRSAVIIDEIFHACDYNPSVSAQTPSCQPLSTALPASASVPKVKQELNRHLYFDSHPKYPASIALGSISSNAEFHLQGQRLAEIPSRQLHGKFDSPSSTSESFLTRYDSQSLGSSREGEIPQPWRPAANAINRPRRLQELDLGSTEQLAKRHPFQKKGFRFWLILGSLMIVIALAAIDMTIISTALPTIVADLPTTKVSGTWITSSFLLTTTAFQPAMGGLADVIGRRNALLVSIAIFVGGSIICAMSSTLLILILGRSIQGIGGGGIQALVEIVVCDITTLRERGMYMGGIGLIFAIACLAAPVLGGYFSAHNWRWIFWINLPIAGVACLLIIPCLKLNTPSMPLKAKLHRMDAVGNVILLGSVVAILIAVTEGGVEYPWSSLRIWLPLTLGHIGLLSFFLIEFIPNRLSRDPILPRRLFSNMTAAVSYILTFAHGIVFYGLLYILPVYFQAVKGMTPLQSAFDLLPATAPAAPMAVIAGLAMAITGTYKAQMVIWWGLTSLGLGLIYMLDFDAPNWACIVFQIVAGSGIGAIFALQLPPIQAALPLSENAHATATFAFSRSFGSVWGIALATAIFTAKVDPLLAKIHGLAEIGLSGHTALAFAPNLAKDVPAPLLMAVRVAYASALRKAFLFFVPIGVAGCLGSLLLKDIPLPDYNETEHGIHDPQRVLIDPGSEARIQIAPKSFRPESIRPPATPPHSSLRSTEVSRGPLVAAMGRRKDRGVVSPNASHDLLRPCQITIHSPSAFRLHGDQASFGEGDSSLQSADCSLTFLGPSSSSGHGWNSSTEGFVTHSIHLRGANSHPDDDESYVTKSSPNQSPRPPPAESHPSSGPCTPSHVWGTDEPYRAVVDKAPDQDIRWKSPVHESPSALPPLASPLRLRETVHQTTAADDSPLQPSSQTPTLVEPSAHLAGPGEVMSVKKRLRSRARSNSPVKDPLGLAKSPPTAFVRAPAGSNYAAPRIGTPTRQRHLPTHTHLGLYDASPPDYGKARWMSPIRSPQDPIARYSPSSRPITGSPSPTIFKDSAKLPLRPSRPVAVSASTVPTPGETRHPLALQNPVPTSSSEGTVAGLSCPDPTGNDLRASRWSEEVSSRSSKRGHKRALGERRGQEAVEEVDEAEEAEEVITFPTLPSCTSMAQSDRSF